MEEKEGAVEEDLKTQIAELEKQRIEFAQKEIQAICDKYNVKLEGYVMMKATQITIVPNR